MNFSFMLSGTVSHNPTDIMMGFLIMVAGYNAGVFGLDRYVVPFFKKRFGKEGKGHKIAA
jgi:thiosulfate dehydrogenase (quinone) large subunit